MTDPSLERRVRIISQGFNTWRVQVLFEDADLPAGEVSDRLREVKAELATQFGIANAMLEYVELISKKRTRHGLLVQMRIVKQDFPSGTPTFRALPASSEDGNPFSDMRLEASFFPYDEFDQPLTRLGIEARLKNQGFDLACVKWPVVIDALQRMERTNLPITNLEIGHGIIPGPGNPSRLSYGMPRHYEALTTSAWMGVRPVAKGEFICEVSSPSAGSKWGRNVYGRELESKPGLHTRLAAGVGTKLVAHGTRLIAHRDGLLVFQRAGKDKRDRDTCDLVPVRLLADCLAANTILDIQRAEVSLSRPTLILANIEPGRRILSSHPLFIQGNIGEGAEIRCAQSVRIIGNVDGARITADHHLAVTGHVNNATLRAEWTLQVDGVVIESSLYGTDVIVSEIDGGHVEALRQTSINRINDNGGRTAAIRINLHKHLENRQLEGKEALLELRQTLSQIVEICGPEIAFGVTEGNAQRMILKWMREQKSKGAPNYTHAEIQELRTVLEMIPMLQEQVKAIGVELKDITAQLEQADPKPQLPQPSQDST
jgi:hypothetical protein